MLRLLILLFLLERHQCFDVRFHCVRGCHCNRHQYMVVCSRGAFRHIPRFSHLTRALNLNDNFLVNLKVHRFSNNSYEEWQLSEMSLKRNNLSSDSLSLNNFELFPKLRVLRLDGNNITHLPQALFHNNHDLERLSLSGNPLVISNSSVLAALNHSPLLSSLRYLDISRTQLNNKTLPAFFSNFSSLTTLLLQGVDIPLLNSNFTSVLTPISSLRRIDLSQATILEAHQSAFKDFQKLSEVDLSGANMKVDVFETIIHSLNSTAVEVLNIDRIFVHDDHNNHIPHNLFQRYNASSLNVLNLDGNFMAFRNARLPEKLLHPLRHLTDLYLDHCNLLSIPTKAFQNLNYLRKLSLKSNLISCNQGSSCSFLRGSILRRLKYLDLSNNRLCNFVGSISFSDRVFPVLEFLDLKYNNLVRVDASMFRGLSRLLQLDLSHNAFLDDIAPNAFLQLPLLTTLNLESCKHLSRLRQGVFNGLSSLRVLNLRESSLIHVHHSALNELSQLEELYLRKNRFGEMRNSLDNLTMRKSSLKTIDLGENDLTTLPFKLLTSSFDLHTLYLDGNKLCDCTQLRPISSTAFLETLDLSNNLLISPKKECFEIFINLKSLDLSGNPFLCNCPFFDFSRWLLSTGLIDRSHQNYECVAPRSLAGRNIFAYKPSNFDCPIFREAFLVVCLCFSVATLACLAGACFSLQARRGKSSNAHFTTSAPNGKYAPLCEEHKATEHLGSSESFVNDEINEQQQNLVDPTVWKSKSKSNNCFFAKNKKSFFSFAKRTSKNKPLLVTESTVHTEHPSETRESELNVIDGRDLHLRVTPANSFDCQIHVEDSVL